MTRFVPDGPDIPPELLAAQERGAVVFLCGAGVSRTVGLPGFWDLVHRIYASLHESWEGHPAEEGGMSDARPALDRTLLALQMRLSGMSVRRTEDIQSRILAAVDEALAPPQGDLPHHAAILRLSRGPNARPCVVTTNFDTLFERAWHATGHDLASHATTAMPLPGSARFEGCLLYTSPSPRD